MSPSNFGRLLAIDPMSKGFGFVAMEGSERLIDWGLVDLHGKREHHGVRLGALLDRLLPQVLVVEALSDSRRGLRAREVVEESKGVAMDRGMTVETVSRHEVVGRFGGLASSKDTLAPRLAEIFPELLPLLPPKRRAWMAEDARMAIFDALAFALTVLWGPPLA